ncbi:MAG: alpha-galactosidase [Pirellulales bacterium]|nr:alpha-galactosidase [Pirellulales bacterium]
MRKTIPLGLAAALWAAFASLALAVAPTPDEMAAARRWAAARLEGAADAPKAEPPFSFTYDDKPSAELLASWEAKRTTRRLDDRRTEYATTYTDPKTGLAVRCVGVEYGDFPVVEWTVYFRNAGSVNTPILQGIQAIDLGLSRGEGGEYLLRGMSGDNCSPDSYQPFALTLDPGATKTFAPPSVGRPTDGVFPYYNVQVPGGGTIVVIGWPGQWAARFARDAAAGLRVVAGQELTHLTLKPGEEIRAPLVALMFWKGDDPVRAQNLWRRWMLAHNLPRPGGKAIAPILSFCDGGLVPGLKTSESLEKLFIDKLGQEQIQLDYWWIDAGWYPCKDAWQNTGTWEPDPERYPNGLRAVSDYVHARDTKLIVWFEPERAAPDTWLTKNHPEWILGGAGGGLLNLGNRDAWNWLVNHVDKLITEQGIDLYRQDFNIAPLPYWRGADAPDRQGVTENLHVQGYLAYWDELLRRHPGMLIDSCSGGGRRNDIETLRRAVPLLRSDYQWGGAETAPGNQGHTYGLSSWIPFYGQGVYYQPNSFVYCVRSYMCPSFAIVTDVRKNEMDWDLYRRLIGQWRDVAGCMLGDYYPLTPHNLDDAAWIAWQFDRPEQGDGFVQAFRRAGSPYVSAQYRLHGLDPEARYAVTDLDAQDAHELTGKELMDAGLAIAISDKPGAVLIKYKRVGP